VARILLVDDEPSVIAALADALRQAGHEVEAVTDAPAALKRLEVDQPDLLIADAMMPYVTASN
jgi:CheY-like chemotaxis protein